MIFLQKKLWLAWSKFRFLRLPLEKRVRLEVTTDGRHLTFILVSLYEAGYGVQVFGGDWFFRELMLLRKVAPIPFLYGGPDVECGISISDRGGKAETGKSGKRKPENPSTVIHLDYDYFSGLTTKDTELHGKIKPLITQIDTDRRTEAGLRPGSRAGGAFSNPSTSELARDSENTSPYRSAFGPAEAAKPPMTDRGQLIADGGSQRSENRDQRTEALDSASPPHSGPLTLDSAAFADTGQSRSEWSGVFERPSSSSLGSGPAKTPPDQALVVPASASSSVTFDSFAPAHLAPAGLPSAVSRAAAQPPGCGKKKLESVATALRMPYFMHPSVYHKGLHKGSHRFSRQKIGDSRSKLGDTAAKRRRRFRIGFFGTHDREFYTTHYHFPGMNRFEILEIFLNKFGDWMKPLRGFPRDWDPCEIAVSIDDRGGDRKGKSFLPQEHYFAALRECDFVLSPPGWCMPVSHNLIEAMFCGAIPITNAGSFMAPPLVDGRDCLEFSGEADFIAAIEKVLVMSDQEIGKIREVVWDYYSRFLDPKALGKSILKSGCHQIIMNAEENSVPKRNKFQRAVREFMEKYTS